MCTVTLIPDGKGGHFLTSNRDEAPHRASIDIGLRKTRKGEALHYPVDQGAGGTWICMSDLRRAICLLNGAKRKHHHNPPYRRSRGLLVLDAFEFKDFEAFQVEVDLKGIEPFTMILTDRDGAFVLYWNGKVKTMLPIDNLQASIWASSTLYPYPIREKRRQLFKQFLKETPFPTQEEIIQFHHLDTGDPVNGLIMNRGNRVRTVSVTSFHLSPQKANWVHVDLLRQQTHRHVLE